MKQKKKKYIFRIMGFIGVVGLICYWWVFSENLRETMIGNLFLGIVIIIVFIGAIGTMYMQYLEYKEKENL